MRLPALFLAAALVGCTTTQLQTAATDIAAAEQQAERLCAAVPTLVTLGDVANLLVRNLATTIAVDAARAVQAKCVIVAAAQQSTAAGGSLSSSAITLLGNSQALQDLKADIATVTPALPARS